MAAARVVLLMALDKPKLTVVQRSVIKRRVTCADGFVQDESLSVDTEGVDLSLDGALQLKHDVGL